MSIHVCKCTRNGVDEHHLRYPGMSQEWAQRIADKINYGWLDGSDPPQKRIAALEAQLAAITRVAEQYQTEAGRLTAELAAAQETASVMSEELGYRLNERDEARAEAAALRADAERYRWLRSEHADKFRDEVQIWEVRHGDELDAAIDQAKEKT